jgi:HAMP domain-containing protein
MSVCYIENGIITGGHVVKLRHSIATRATICSIIIILIVGILLVQYTYSDAKHALEERMGHELMTVATITASQLNGDVVRAIEPGQENTTAFLDVQNTLNRIRSSSQDIKYIYVMRKAGEKVEFVVDGDYGFDPEAASIGDIYDETSPAMLDGFTVPSADDHFTTDQWGTVLSGYAPIKNSAGVVVGIVGVDMDSDRVIQQQNVIGGTVYVVIIMTALAMAVVIAFFMFTTFRDMRKLIRSAEKVSDGDLNVLIDVWRKDEIGELAEAFNKMVASLNFERKMRQLEPMGPAPVMKDEPQPAKTEEQ